MLCTKGTVQLGEGLGGQAAILNGVARAGLTEKVRLGQDLKEVSQAEVCGKGIPGRGNSQREVPRLECI